MFCFGRCDTFLDISFRVVLNQSRAFPDMEAPLQIVIEKIKIDKREELRQLRAGKHTGIPLDAIDDLIKPSQ